MGRFGAISGLTPASGAAGRPVSKAPARGGTGVKLRTQAWGRAMANSVAGGSSLRRQSAWNGRVPAPEQQVMSRSQKLGAAGYEDLAFQDTCAESASRVVSVAGASHADELCASAIKDVFMASSRLG